MLAIYLVVLVPINWLVFWAMGRVEWAWIAAPLIAIAGAISVAKLASLDIGFVRSNTQIGLLEVHTDYSRGHLTEYSALYTSLSTGYQIDLSNHTSQCLPFANVSREESLSQVTLRRSRENRLENFMIRSNSTGLLHSESILDLGGPISLAPNGQDQPSTEFVENRSQYDLKDAGIIGRTDSGQLQVAWIGDLPAATRSDRLKFEPCDNKNKADCWTKCPIYQGSDWLSASIWTKHFEQEEGIPTIATVGQLSSLPELMPDWPKYESVLRRLYPDVSPNDLPEIEVGFAGFQKIFQLVNSGSALSLGRLFHAVSKNLQLGSGEYRLIGYTDQAVGTTSIVPAATQTNRRTLVVVHLRPAILPQAGRDRNALADFKGKSNLDWDADSDDDLDGDQSGGEPDGDTNE
jgi:hypothetical protein